MLVLGVVEEEKAIILQGGSLQGVDMGMGIGRTGIHWNCRDWVKASDLYMSMRPGGHCGLGTFWAVG